MKEFWTRRIITWGRRLLREESGQSIAEYVLILFIVMMIAMKVKSTLITRINNMADKVGNDMEQFGNGP